MRTALVLFALCSALLAEPTIAVNIDGADDAFTPKAGTQVDLLVTVTPEIAGVALEGLKVEATSTGASFEAAILPPPDEEATYGAPFTVRIPMQVTADDVFEVAVKVTGKDGKGGAIAASGKGELFALPNPDADGTGLGAGFGEEKKGVLKLKSASFKTIPAKAGKRNVLVVELELTGDEYHVYGSEAEDKLGIKTKVMVLPNGPERAWLATGNVVPKGKQFHGTFTVEVPITPTRAGTHETRVRLLWQACTNQFCIDTGIAYPTISFEAVEGDGGPIEDPMHGVASGQAVDDDVGAQSIWLLFFGAIAAGLFALLMPCTYPLIPITISFFTKQAEQRDGKVTGLALAYGFGIVAVFAGIGAVVGLTTVTGKDVLDFATNPWVNGLFALLFLIFGLSLIGLYEIRLPRAFDNLAMKTGGGGGYFSVFAMGTTLVITSFTCTAPFIGTLLVYATQSGDWMRVTACMGVFGLTMAIPFVLLALSPTALQSLPRSGIWMKHLKVVLGIIELGLVLKFLSNIDFAFGTAIIRRDTFIILFGGCFFIAALYLIDFPALFRKDGSWSLRKGTVIAILVLCSIGGYFYSGLGGTPLSSESVESFLPRWKAVYDKTFAAIVKEDYDAGVAKAQELGVPIFLHFTGFQ